VAARNQAIEAGFSRSYQRELLIIHRKAMVSSTNIHAGSSTKEPGGEIGTSSSSKFLPTLKLVLRYSDLITELTPGDASHIEKIESFGTHNEDGDITMEIDHDNRDGKAGKHNG